MPAILLVVTSDESIKDQKYLVQVPYYEHIQ
jgi:hypothetical protein